MKVIGVLNNLSECKETLRLKCLRTTALRYYSHFHSLFLSFILHLWVRHKQVEKKGHRSMCPGGDQKKRTGEGQYKFFLYSNYKQHNLSIIEGWLITFNTG